LKLPNILAKPLATKTNYFPFSNLENIKIMIVDPANFLTRERKALILEQVLIGFFGPEENRAKNIY